jgi:hypothetical protein
MLQSDIRKILGRTFRPGEKRSQVFLDTLDRARDEIFYAQTEGHRAPRPQEFEWDDHDPRRI